MGMAAPRPQVSSTTGEMPVYSPSLSVTQRVAPVTRQATRGPAQLSSLTLWRFQPRGGRFSDALELGGE